MCPWISTVYTVLEYDIIEPYTPSMGSFRASAPPENDQGWLNPPVNFFFTLHATRFLRYWTDFYFI